jgi:hypothetical protein
MNKFKVAALAIAFTSLAAGVPTQLAAQAVSFTQTGPSFVGTYAVRCSYSACGKQHSWTEPGVSPYRRDRLRLLCSDQYLRAKSKCPLKSLTIALQVCRVEGCRNCPTAPSEAFDCSLPAGAERRVGAQCECFGPSGMYGVRGVLRGTVVNK